MSAAELRQLRYFLVLAEELSFTRAAARLPIAQQSLSQQIGALEKQLGARLFDRDHRGTRLTAVGPLFVPEARAVVDRAEEAVATVRRALQGQIGTLRLAFLNTVANHLVPPVVRALRQHLPDLTVSTASTSIKTLVTASSTANTTLPSPGRRSLRAWSRGRWRPNRSVPCCPKGIPWPNARNCTSPPWRTNHGS